MTGAAAPAIRRSIDIALDLEESDRLLAQHLAEAVYRYGSAALGVIDLPTLATGRLVPAQIRVCGVLYWTSEIEKAGLVPFVEALSEGVVRGTILQPLGGAAAELARMWRTRERRFTASERHALFQRIFGGSVDEGSAFPQLFQSLIQTLVAIGRAPRDEGTGHLEARAAVGAAQLGEYLSDAGTGIAAFAAREIVDQIRGALRILGDAAVVRALGGGSPWQLIVRHAARLLGAAVQPQRHLALGRAGLPIIGWIANEVPAIESGHVRIRRTARVVRDAESWSAAYGVV